MEMIKLSSKGQIVIPQRIREELKLNEDSFIVMETIDNAVMMKKVEIDEDLFGQFKRSLEDLKNGKVRRVA